MAKIRKSMSFDAETVLKLEEIALVRHDTSPSALTNAAAASVHAYHSKLTTQTKKVLRDEKKPKFFEMVLILWNWYKTEKAKEDSQSESNT